MPAIVLLGTAFPAIAQDAGGASPVSVPGVEAPTSGQEKRSYVPADFARFAPRSAFDMLSQVPGFAIDSGDLARRGLGEATGNVLINGQRFSGKSTDIVAELKQIHAGNVARIEIADGASLEVAGLSGQVANVVTIPRGVRGNFTWRPQYRPEIDRFRAFNGELSVSGTTSRFEYSLGLSNGSSIFGSTGPELVVDGAGATIDQRRESAAGSTDSPRITVNLNRRFPGGALLNLRAGAGLYFYDWQETSLRSGVAQPPRSRLNVERQHGWNYEIGGDYEFALGPGRFKIIGLRNFDRSPYIQIVTQSVADGRPMTGSRFRQLAIKDETIARSEYRLPIVGGDLQLSIEGALNRLGIENELFRFETGRFLAEPFPDVAARVEEKRGEIAIGYGRPLSSSLTLQSSLGAEYSRLTQSGANGLSRTFYRPKGFFALAWRPRPNLDVGARIEREVGQLNFSDFVASTNISSGTANSGNANLVPPQSWNGEVRATGNFGKWATATLRLYGKLVSDIVDIVPIGAAGQAPGNLDSAALYGLQWTSSFSFDPVGVRGAKLNLTLRFQTSDLKDPLTGAGRQISDTVYREIDINYRHDLEGGDWAYGGSFTQSRRSPGFRLDQINRSIAPSPLGLFVEHKNVMGLTVRASVDNISDSKDSFSRSFYDGRRTNGLVFTESRLRTLGPMFTLAIGGTF